MTRSEYILLAEALRKSKPIKQATESKLADIVNKQHMLDCIVIANALQEHSSGFEHQTFMRNCGYNV